MDLHGKIMNLQERKTEQQIRDELRASDYHGDQIVIAYVMGFRDARHAAAELVAAAEGDGDIVDFG